jgi:hypothetical protein
MSDDALRRQLTDVKYLLLLAVALLSGLVFGRDPYAEMQVALVSFLLLGTVFAVRSLGLGAE